MAKKIIAALLLLTAISCGPGRYEQTFVVAGTFVRVISDDPRAASIVHAEFIRLDNILNAYKPDSDISRLNAGKTAAVKVSPELCELVVLACSAYETSEGHFDASQGAVYARWKECLDHFESAQCPPEQKEIASLLVNKGINSLLVDSDNNTVTITDERVILDLSGIAKGFMVDKAVNKLRRAGVSSALIDAGGDIYCLGSNPRGGPWIVGIRHPSDKKEVVYPLALADQAVATSGSYEQFFEWQGERYSHIIDLLSGQPVPRKMISMTVVAANATTADALATAFFSMGVEGTRNYLIRHATTLQVYALTEEEKGLKIDVLQ